MPGLWLNKLNSVDANGTRENPVPVRVDRLALSDAAGGVMDLGRHAAVMAFISNPDLHRETGMPMR